jgi:hypothetical protein
MNVPFDHEASQAAKDRNTSLKGLSMIGYYGYTKAKRELMSRTAKAIVNLGQVIAHLLTVFTGLTAALILEGTNAALGACRSKISCTAEPAEIDRTLWMPCAPVGCPEVS